MTLQELSTYFHTYSVGNGTWNNIGHDWMINNINKCAEQLKKYVEAAYPTTSYLTIGSDIRNYVGIFYQGLEQVQCYADDIASRRFTKMN